MKALKLTMDPARETTILQSRRSAWIDNARGLGVVLVVFGHILTGLVRAGLFPDGLLSRWMDFGLYTFHMPLFFFLAGLNVPSSLRHGPRTFLQVKAWTIAYPYLLWSLVQGTLIMSLARDVNVPITAADLAAIPYRPLAQFWFLYALMICHVLAVLIPSRVVMAVVSAVGFVVFLALPVRPDLALTLHHFPLYVAGLYASRVMTGWNPPGTWVSAGIVWVGFGVAVLVAGTFSSDSNGLLAIPACLLGVTGIVWISKLFAQTGLSWLSVIGQMSMTIYVLHIMAGAGLRFAMVRLHVPPIPFVYLLAGTAAGVMVPMIVHVVLARAGLLPWFGLSYWRRPAPQSA